VLAPLVFAHRADQPQLVARALAAFALFCAAASAIYLVNDLRDREADRNHPLKSRRPIASGALPAGVAIAAAALLGLGALAGAYALDAMFVVALASYIALNLLYSFGLKHIVILDVMSIAASFMIRVLGGAAAIDVEISRWLVLCGSFLALFLAFSKRRHELTLLAAGAADQRKVLSDYNESFLDQMMNVVTASTVVSYALYAASPETAERLGTTHLLWTLPMVLYGVFRFLYLVHRRDELLNPTEAILRDPPFLLNFALWAAVVVGLIYGR